MAEAILHVRVVTPEKPVYEGEASLVIVPAHDGEVGIQARHVRFLASLGFGLGAGPFALSLGSVIAYRLLRQIETRADVPLLVTLGSPLGICTIKEHLSPPSLAV